MRFRYYVHATSAIRYEIIIKIDLNGSPYHLYALLKIIWALSTTICKLFGD